MSLQRLKDFDIEGATAYIWVFKKTTYANRPPRFVGRWIATTERLEERLKNTISSAVANINEVMEYGLLTQNNEESALMITRDETNAPLVLAHCGAAETAENKASRIENLNNSAFYVVKLISGRNVLYGVKKTGPSWKTVSAKGLTSIIFSDQTLDLKEDPTFNLTNNIDFFISEDALFILNKANFESILSYKAAHLNDLAALQNEPEFNNLFFDMEPLVQNIGGHKIQLRRMSAIRQKGHYRNNNFMNNLRTHCASLGLNINFDNNGKIIPCNDTWRDIITALLDHRLESRLSENIYDVPDTKNVRRTH